MATTVVTQIDGATTKLHAEGWREFTDRCNACLAAGSHFIEARIVAGPPTYVLLNIDTIARVGEWEQF